MNTTELTRVASILTLQLMVLSLGSIAWLGLLTSLTYGQEASQQDVIDRIVAVWRESVPKPVHVRWRSHVLHTQAAREALSRSLDARSGTATTPAGTLKFEEYHELLASRGRARHTIKGKVPVNFSAELLDRESVSIYDGPRHVFRCLDRSLIGEQYLNVTIDDLRDLFSKISLPDQPPFIWALRDPSILKGFQFDSVRNGIVTLVRHTSGNEESEHQLQLDADRGYSLVSETRRRRTSGTWRVTSSTEITYVDENGARIPKEWLYQYFNDSSILEIAVSSKILGYEFVKDVAHEAFNPKLPPGTMIVDQRSGGNTRFVIDKRGHERIIPPNRDAGLTYLQAIDPYSDFPYRYGHPISRFLAVAGIVLGIGFAFAVAALRRRGGYSAH